VKVELTSENDLFFH
jgi:hypothetical protein